MSAFEKIKDQLLSVEKGNANLLDFYVMVWQEGMTLPGDQLNTLIQSAKTISLRSPQTKAWFLLSEGFLYTFFPSYGNIFERLSEALTAFQEINDKPGEGAVQTLLIIYFKNIGQLDKAQECAQNAILNIDGNETYLYFTGISYYQAGEIHHLLKDHKTAIDLFNKGLSYAIEGAIINPRFLSAIGTVYKDMNELDLAYDYFQRSLKLIQGENHPLLESKIYADLGNYYFKMGNFDQSLVYQQKSIQLRIERKITQPLITNYIELAELYLKQNKYEAALSNVQQAEKLAIEYNAIIRLYQTYFVFSSIYEAMNEPALSLQYYKKYHQAKDEVLGQENARKIKQISMHHEMESMQKEKEIFKLRNVVLKNALDEIEASVRYAQRIQHAILPPTQLIKEKLPDSFILYKPKDIVAGDFYWMEEINETIFIAAADCTGHGVPGAMVSVVCSNALNRAVKEFKLSNTGKILDKVTDLVIETFEKSSSDVKDGMDISLLSINKKTKQINWSGANNPLCCFKNNQLTQIVADKQPVGKSDVRKPFTTHTIEYETNTVFYLFTDGYADQFGGEHGKKYMHKQLKEFLLSIANEPMEAQKQKLSECFDTWKNDLEQVDDVCVIGVRI